MSPKGLNIRKWSCFRPLNSRRNVNNIIFSIYKRRKWYHTLVTQLLSGGAKIQALPLQLEFLLIPANCPFNLFSLTKYVQQRQATVLKSPKTSNGTQVNIAQNWTKIH